MDGTFGGMNPGDFHPSSRMKADGNVPTPGGEGHAGWFQLQSSKPQLTI
jgi:hypothetical protein